MQFKSACPESAPLGLQHVLICGFKAIKSRSEKAVIQLEDESVTPGAWVSVFRAKNGGVCRNILSDCASTASCVEEIGKNKIRSDL